MTVENIPWMIHGGKHSAASGRRVLFKATGGGEGVAAIGDCKVVQNGVANGTVITGPGGCTLRSRYPGIRGESYDGQVLTDTAVAIAPNGGGATRYDMVIMRIDDWNFPGQQSVPAGLPRDDVPVTKLAVIQGVAATAKTALDAVPNLAYPAVALARIAIPAGTSAITNAMITDLRKMAVARKEPAMRAKSLVAADAETLTNTTAAGEQWPNAALFTVECPEWASRAVVSLRLNGVRVPVGNAWGQIWARIGHGEPDVITTPSTTFDTPNSTSTARESWECASEVAVPASLRGKTLTVLPMGKIDGMSGAAARPSMDGGSSVVLDIQWVEAPAADG